MEREQKRRIMSHSTTKERPTKMAIQGKVLKAKPDWHRMINFYDLLPKEDTTQYRNRTKHLHGLEHPSMFMFAGPTGAGKTTLLLNILHQMLGAFDELYIFSLFGKDDPLYKWCQEHFQGEVMVTNNLDDLPEVTTLDPSIQRAFIFDDIMSCPPKTQKKIEQYFCTVRHKNGSAFYCTQKYHKAPLAIRGQCQYVFLLRNIHKPDLRSIAAVYGDPQTIENMYDYCIKKEKPFWINTRKIGAGRFRCGFDEVLAQP